MSDEKKKLKQKHIEKLEERQREASLVRKIVFISLILIILAVGGVGYGVYQHIVGAIGPVDETDDQIIEVTIPIGSTVRRIGNILEEHDVISNADIFRYYIRFTNESGLQAGDYELTRSMNLDEIIEELKQGSVQQEYELTFTIPEGRWLNDVVTRVANETNLTEDEIMEKMEDEEYLQSLIDSYSILEEAILDSQIRWPLEGYLFPSRYDFVNADVEVEQVIDAMLRRTESVLSESGAAASEYSYHEILTIASIIEGEARNDEERARISGVIHNRLDINMKLEMDPTVAYAHGEHLERTLYEDLRIDSPYNTYEIVGLPVGPINNPGAASIRAALMPEDHNYLFFFHAPSGEVYFTKTFVEHQRIIQQYR
ncbi:MAG: endolytic transglycosylase MltG [Bacillus sp. (in: Bacteria)]|nr:endolytic transglycosylase MltG [Bacillus sp. (in: firmicutes)]